MNMLRTFIADDEPLALERLKVLFGDIAGIEVVGTASDGCEASRSIEALSPDLVVLDVQMPGQNGLRVAATLAGENKPEVIFVTAFEDYAADAFDVEAADYLLKPVRFDRLWQAVERAKRRQQMRALAGRALQMESRGEPSEESRGGGQDSGIWVDSRTGSVFVPLETVDWIEAARDYVMLHTKTRSHIVRLSMRALETKVPAEQLMRVHRSAFVRPANVVEVQKVGRTISALVLADGAVVKVGPNYAKAVAARLSL